MYGTANVGTLGTTGEDGPYHRGALLVALKTIVPYYQQGVRSTNVEPVTPIKPVSFVCTVIIITTKYKTKSFPAVCRFVPMCV
jgi:hypothetical protein